jgi:uncharacterized phage protein gp47/JayE
MINLMEYGLTEKGFVVKPFQVILEEEREAFKAAFGSDIDTSSDSPEGAYIGNQAIKMTQLWEMLGGLFAAGDSDAASGVYLDRLVSLVNVQRNPAEATRVYAALWGNEGTSVHAGHLAKLVSGEQFALQEPIKIGRENLLGFSFKITELVVDTYIFTLDGNPISYTATGDDTEEAIQAGLFDRIEAVLPGIYTAVNSGSDGMEIHSIIGIVPFVLFCDDPKIEIASLGSEGIYKAVIPGPTFAAIRTLNKIVSNVDGLNRIINYATGITGKNTESDTELRIEKNNRQKQASGNEIAIKNAVENVPGVLYAEVYSNRTQETVNGRPGKSYETIVVGGLDQEIATAIFNKGAAGIQAFGNTVVTVIDDEGFPQEIGFSRPENRFVWIKIAYSRNPEEPFPVNGAEMIKENIDAWGAENQDVGKDFVFQKLNRPIYDVPGVGFADIKVAATDNLTPPEDAAYQAENIILDERQIAVIDKSRISIEELIT